MATGTLRPKLRADEFDGGANEQRDAGNGKDLFNRLNALDQAATFIGEFATAGLPVTLEEWQALEFDEVPSAGMSAWDTTTGLPVVWDGSQWVTVSNTGRTEATGSVGAKIALAEGTDNGTSKMFVQAPASLAADRTVLGPSGGDLDLEKVRSGFVAPPSRRWAPRTARPSR
jgi:hypothetical protein